MDASKLETLLELVGLKPFLRVYRPEAVKTSHQRGAGGFATVWAG